METPVDITQLRQFLEQVYETLDVPALDARLIADTLIQADLWGHQSHGTLRTSWYVDRLVSGVMQAKTTPRIINNAKAVSVIDGQHGVGQVIAKHAMEMAIEKAKAYGTSTVAVRNSNHFGTVMYFTRLATQANCVAFMTTNGGPAMAPWGGYKRKIIGTNPWSIASPAGQHSPMMLDIANTGVARGKIYLAKQRREAIPEGWALAADGQPTTDPVEAIAGIILPMAAHKGYGIGVMMDLLAGVLSGSRYLDDVNGPYHSDRISGVGHHITVYDVEAFMPLAEFNERVEDFIKRLKQEPVAPGVEEIFYPGEKEEKTDALQRKSGLHLPEDTLKDLKKVAQKMELNYEAFFNI